VGPQVTLGRSARAAGREPRHRPESAERGGDAERLAAHNALWKQQARATDKKKREALLQRIQQIALDRVRFAGIWDYVWPSGVGPRVAEPAFLLIDPYPWSAPSEELRLKNRGMSAP